MQWIQHILLIMVGIIIIDASDVSVGCPSHGSIYRGQNHSICYWVTYDKHDVDSGHSACQLDGGTIGEIPDQNALEFLKCSLPTILEEFVWIGYNERNTEGTFTNWNGEPMNWHNLYFGISFDPLGNSDCVVMYVNSSSTFNYFWRKEECSVGPLYRVLCSKVQIDVQDTEGNFDPNLKILHFETITERTLLEVGKNVETAEASTLMKCLIAVCHQNVQCKMAAFNPITNVCLTFKSCHKMDSTLPVDVQNLSVWMIK